MSPGGVGGASVARWAGVDPGVRGRGHGRVSYAGRLDLEQTFSSGQAFRWRLRGGWWYGFVAGDLVRLRQDVEASQLVFESARGVAGRKELERYFRLKEPFPEVVAELSRDPHVAEAAQRFPGLRLLAQDPWELIVSFVVSANSNLPRIAANLEALAQRAGEPVALGGWVRCLFPSPDALARLSEEDLRATGIGYRARYVAGAARMVAEAFLDPEDLAVLPSPAARERLLEVPGVGEKVADCILLFTGSHDGAFPVDVWVRRVMQRLYFEGQQVSARRIRALAWELWGARAGVAQQLLFHHARTTQNHART